MKDISKVRDSSRDEIAVIDRLVLNIYETSTGRKEFSFNNPLVGSLRDTKQDLQPYKSGLFYKDSRNKQRQWTNYLERPAVNLFTKKHAKYLIDYLLHSIIPNAIYTSTDSYTYEIKLIEVAKDLYHRSTEQRDTTYKAITGKLVNNPYYEDTGKAYYYRKRRQAFRKYSIQDEDNLKLKIYSKSKKPTFIVRTELQDSNIYRGSYNTLAKDLWHILTERVSELDNLLQLSSPLSNTMLLNDSFPLALAS